MEQIFCAFCLKEDYKVVPIDGSDKCIRCGEYNNNRYSLSDCIIYLRSVRDSLSSSILLAEKLNKILEGI